MSSWTDAPNYITTPDRRVDIPTPEWRVMPEEALFGCGDGRPDVAALAEHLRREGRLEQAAVQRLVSELRSSLFPLPNLATISGPVTVVGDLHGQYYDLLQVLEREGLPPRTRYVFLGDYVDRGSFGVEVCLLLFALRLAHPESVVLLRGNHESRTATAHFSFRRECQVKYSDDEYMAFMDAFDSLQLACAVDCGASGRALCVHAGLGPEWRRLDDIEAVDRFGEPPREGLFCDVLWSDPLGDDTAEGLSEADLEEWRAVSFVPNPDRGCSYVYGYAAVLPFCRDNGIATLVRGHEVQKEGYALHRMTLAQEQRAVPLAMTVFTAPNYCDTYQNTAAVLHLFDGMHCAPLDLWTFQSVEHPFWTPRFSNAFELSMTLITEQLTSIMKRAAKALREPRPVQRRPGMIAKTHSLGTIERVQRDTVTRVSVREKAASWSKPAPIIVSGKRKSVDKIPSGIIREATQLYSSIERNKHKWQGWTNPEVQLELEMLRGVLSRARAAHIAKGTQLPPAHLTRWRCIAVDNVFEIAKEEDYENEMLPPIVDVREFWERTTAPAPAPTRTPTPTPSKQPVVSPALRASSRSPSRSPSGSPRLSPTVRSPSDPTIVSPVSRSRAPEIYKRSPLGQSPAVSPLAGLRQRAPAPPTELVLDETILERKRPPSPVQASPNPSPSPSVALRAPRTLASPARLLPCVADVDVAAEEHWWPSVIKLFAVLSLCGAFGIVVGDLLS
eukprot:m51a1_g502 hypothetical protein (729) ;mRNA; f:281034-283727